MPSQADIEAARRLLAQVVDSFEKLEIVVHVYRARWILATPDELANALPIPPGEIERSLTVLQTERVLDPRGPWARAVAALVQMYDEDRIEVMNLMTKTALARVRKEAGRVFADAFVLRTKKKADPDT